VGGQGYGLAVALPRLGLPEALALAERAVDDALLAPCAGAASPLVVLMPFLAACCGRPGPPAPASHGLVRMAAAAAAAAAAARVLEEAAADADGRAVGGRGVRRAVVRAALACMTRLAALLPATAERAAQDPAAAGPAGHLADAADGLLAAAAGMLSDGPQGVSGPWARLQWLKLSESVRVARDLLAHDPQAPSAAPGSAKKRRRGSRGDGGSKGASGTEWPADTGLSLHDVFVAETCAIAAGAGGPDAGQGSGEAAGDEGAAAEEEEEEEGLEGAGAAGAEKDDSDGFESPVEDPRFAYYALRRRPRAGQAGRKRALDVEEEEEEEEEESLVINYR
jgi:hypothetical protein